MGTPSPAKGIVKVDREPSSSSSAQYQYETHLVTTNEWLHENITNDFFGRVKRYLISLFPIFSWIYRYNLTWAIGGKLISESYF